MFCIKKVRLKIFCSVLAGLIVAILVAAAAVKFWLGPAILRGHLSQTISGRWDGHVAVEDIQFSFFSPVRVSTILLSDSAGDRWLAMRGTKLTLANWHKLRPTLTGIEAETLDLNLHFIGGKCALPLYPVDKRRAGLRRPRIDLQRLVIQTASVAVVQENKTNVTYDGLTLNIVRKQNSYEVSISKSSHAASEVFAIKGAINPTILEANLSLQIKRQVKNAESVMFCSLLGILQSYQAEGGLTADVSISGCLKEPTSLQLTGSIKLDNWVIEENDNIIADKLSAQVELDGPRLHVKKLTFSDGAGQPWLGADVVNLTLSRWPGLRPVLSEIETEQLGLRASFTDGKLVIPLKVASHKTAGPKRSFFDIQKIAMRNTSLTVAGDKDLKVHFDHLLIEAVKKENIYDVLVSRKVPEGASTILIKGTVDPITLAAQLSVQAEHTVKKSETDILLALLNSPKSYQAEGGLTSDVSISGCLKEPTSLQLKGSIKLDNWVIEENSNLIADKLSAKVELDGPRLHVKNLTASDSTGQPWLGADVVSLTLSRWPGLRPVLSEIETEQLGLRTSFADGKLVIPLKVAASETAGPKRSYLDIQKIAMRNTSVTVTGDKDLKVIDNLLIEAVRNENIYDVLVSRKVPEGSSTILIKGTVDPITLATQLSVQAEHTVKKSETDILLTLLSFPALFQAEGGLTANMQVAGDIRNLASYKSEGMIMLKDGAISAKNGTLAEQVNILARLSNQRIDVESFTGVSCNGQINGNSYLEVKGQGPVQFGGRLSGTGVNLAELTNVLATSKRMSGGTASFQYNFTSSGKELKDLQAQGLIFMDDADFRVVPIIPHIFRAVGLRNYDPLRMSDATAIFSMNGPTATFKRARLSNPFGAIEAEPNGTINLQTGEMDFYVVAAPLNEIHFVLRRIPIVNLFVQLKDKLSRLHIKGNWSTPPNKLVVKEPLIDIKEGTVDFLRGVVETGGHFTKVMRDTSRAIFANSQKNKLTENKPSSKNP